METPRDENEVKQKQNYRGANKSLARPTSRCILCDGENISFDASLAIYINSTIKTLPLQAIGGPEGSRKLRPLDFLTTAQYSGRLSALRAGRLYPQGYSWYSFSLGVESTPWPWFGRKEMCH